MSTSEDLKKLFAEGRPLVEQWLDIAEQFAALGRVAREKGLDWGQIKALLKAQAQDDRDESGDGKRIAKIIEKADFASSYADMLGLTKMNNKIFSDAHFGEFEAAQIVEAALIETSNPVRPSDDLDIPPFLDHRQKVGAA